MYVYMYVYVTFPKGNLPFLKKLPGILFPFINSPDFARNDRLVDKILH